MVSMLPTVDSNLWAIEGGNFQLAERLVQASNASSHIPVHISAVRKSGAFYTLESQVR